MQHSLLNEATEIEKVANNSNSDEKALSPYERIIQSETKTAEQFLRTLYNEGYGYLSIWERATNQTRWFSTTQLSEAAETAYKMANGGLEVYFGVGLHEMPCGTTSRGKAETVSSIPGLWVDIDIAGPGHSQTNLPQNVDEARSIIKTVPFPPTIVVHTGGGLHVYWLFNNPWVLNSTEDKKQAKELSERFQKQLLSFAKTREWKLDYTGDLARVLRVPGTKNYKIQDNPRSVEMIEWHKENRYARETFAEFLKVPETNGLEETKAAEESADYPGTVADIVNNCKFIQHGRDDSETLEEPHWHAMIAILNLVPGSNSTIHSFSKDYPRYTHEETERKIQEVSRENLPCNCSYINEELGFPCPTGGCGVKSPISFASNHGVVAKLRIKELSSVILDNPLRAFDEDVQGWLVILENYDPGEFDRFKKRLQGRIDLNLLKKKIRQTRENQISNQREDCESEYFQSFSQTDKGNADRLIEFAKNLRYCNQTKKWYIFDETKWEEDDTQKVKGLAVKSIDYVTGKAKAELQGEVLNNVLKWCDRSRSNSAIKAMVEMAQYGENIPVMRDAFDRNPYFLNCQNGTIDLRTGELLDHNMAHLISKCIPTHYAPDVSCPTWETFIVDAMGNNDEAIDYLQTAVGLTLTGVPIKLFFFVYGPSNTGKSRFVETINYLLGDYSKGLPIDVLMRSRFDTGRGPNPELVRLLGARAVVTSETTDGRRLDEALIKRITGGDTMTVRGLYSEPIDFIPYYKLWIHGNYRPVIQGDDSGIWNRLVLVPFRNIIPAEEQDPNLFNKFKEELPGILAWAVRGCVKWINSGELLPKLPEMFMNETAGYQERMDTLGLFLQDCCNQGDDKRVEPSALYEAYINWCSRNGISSALNNPTFKTRLEERGFKQERDHQGRFWKGISLNVLPEATGPEAFINTLTNIGVAQVENEYEAQSLFNAI